MRKTLSAWRLHVLGAHVDVALEAEQRARRRRRDAVLPGAGLGHDAPLPHPHREQRLAERVVDLVRAGVRQVLALQKDPRAAARLRSAAGLRRSASAVRRSPSAAARARPGTPDRRARGKIGALELLDRLDERLGHEAPAELAEVAARVRISSSRTSRSSVTSTACARPQTARGCARDPSRRASARRPTTRRCRRAARARPPRRRCPASARRRAASGAARRDGRSRRPVDRAAGAAAPDRIVHVEQQRRPPRPDVDRSPGVRRLVDRHALMTGYGMPAAYDAFSSPWSCTAPRRTSAATP